MKKILIAITILVLATIVYAASFDRRGFNQNQGEPVFRAELPQMTRDSGDANDVSEDIILNGIIRQITVGVNDNTGNKTVTIDIIDDNGSVLFTTATIAENTASAPTMQNYMTIADVNSPLTILVTGTITINANLSGDPGSGGMTIDVVLYGD